MDNINVCHFCYNARLDNELTDDNDYSACCIGESLKGYRFMLCSGWGKPLRIEFDIWNAEVRRNSTVGIYFPKFCPECGRKIDEYG